MAETEEKRGPLGLFFANDLNDPRVNPQLRQRIALQMLSQQKGYPKTFGEGLGAIGDAIGDRAMMNRLAQADIAGGEQRKSDIDEVRPPPVAALPTNARAEAPTDVAAPPVVTAALQQPTNAAPPPPPPQQPPDIPPEVMANPQGRGIAPPPPTPPGVAVPQLNPRARAAFLLASRLQGGTPVNPTAAGAQTPAPAPLQPSVPPPVAGGDTDFGSQQRPGVTRDIRPAPPPGYEPPSFEPYTDVQRRAILKARSRPYDAALQEDMQKIIAEEEVGRQQRQKVRDDLRAFNSPAAVLERQKKAADLAHTEQQTRIGSLIDPNDKRYTLGPDGVARPIKVEGEDANTKPTYIPKTDTQAKAFNYFGRAHLGHEGLTPEAEKVLSTSPVSGALVKMMPAKVAAQYKEAYDHSEHFVQAFVRSLSGANIPDSELEKEARTMIPRYGDTPQQIENKRLQRAVFVNGQATTIGDQGVKAAMWEINRLRAANAEQKAAKDTEAAAWARRNPNDPRAAQILQRLGGR